jgi:hypothetical protein
MHRVDRFLTRDFTSRVPTHSIGDDIEPQDVVDQEGVLIQLSALAYVGQSRTVVLQLVLIQQWRPPTGLVPLG